MNNEEITRLSKMNNDIGNINRGDGENFNIKDTINEMHPLE